MFAAGSPGVREALSSPRASLSSPSSKESTPSGQPLYHSQHTLHRQQLLPHHPQEHSVPLPAEELSMAMWLNGTARQGLDHVGAPGPMCIAELAAAGAQGQRLAMATAAAATGAMVGAGDAGTRQVASLLGSHPLSAPAPAPTSPIPSGRSARCSGLSSGALLAETGGLAMDWTGLSAGGASPLRALGQGGSGGDQDGAEQDGLALPPRGGAQDVREPGAVAALLSMSPVASRPGHGSGEAAHVLCPHLSALQPHQGPVPQPHVGVSPSALAGRGEAQPAWGPGPEMLDYAAALGYAQAGAGRLNEVVDYNEDEDGDYAREEVADESEEEDAREEGAEVEDFARVCEDFDAVPSPGRSASACHLRRRRRRGMEEERPEPALELRQALPVGGVGVVAPSGAVVRLQKRRGGRAKSLGLGGGRGASHGPAARRGVSRIGGNAPSTTLTPAQQRSTSVQLASLMTAPREKLQGPGSPAASLEDVAFSNTFGPGLQLELHHYLTYGRNVSAQYWADTLRKEMARAVWMMQALGAAPHSLASSEDLAAMLRSNRAVVTALYRTGKDESLPGSAPCSEASVLRRRAAINILLEAVGLKPEKMPARRRNSGDGARSSSDGRAKGKVGSRLIGQGHEDRDEGKENYMVRHGGRTARRQSYRGAFLDVDDPHVLAASGLHVHSTGPLKGGSDDAEGGEDGLDGEDEDGGLEDCGGQEDERDEGDGQMGVKVDLAGDRAPVKKEAILPTPSYKRRNSQKGGKIHKTPLDRVLERRLEAFLIAQHKLTLASAANYLSHIRTMLREALEALGDDRRGLDGAQAVDILQSPALAGSDYAEHRPSYWAAFVKFLELHYGLRAVGCGVSSCKHHRVIPPAKKTDAGSVEQKKRTPRPKSTPLTAPTPAFPSPSVPTPASAVALTTGAASSPRPAKVLRLSSTGKISLSSIRRPRLSMNEPMSANDEHNDGRRRRKSMTRAHRGDPEAEKAREYDATEGEEDEHEGRAWVVGSGHYQLVGKGAQAAKRGSSLSNGTSGTANERRGAHKAMSSDGYAASAASFAALHAAAGAFATTEAGAEPGFSRGQRPVSAMIRLSLDHPSRSPLHLVTPSPQIGGNRSLAKAERYAEKGMLADL